MLVLKASGFGDHRNVMLEDTAILTGAMIYFSVPLKPFRKNSPAPPGLSRMQAYHVQSEAHPIPSPLHVPDIAGYIRNALHRSCSWPE